MKNRLIKGIERASKWFGGLQKTTLICLMIFLVCFALLQIILRNFFRTGFVWGDTLLRHVVLWISFLGAALATAEKKHIEIDILPRLFPGRGRKVIRKISDLFSLMISAVLFIASCRFILDERTAKGIAFGDVPYWWLELIFPISFALMFIRFGLNLAEGQTGASDGGTS